ncbi:NAD(P)-dependent oxidoreductase [Mycolicibacterium sp. S2-37]|uniref:NAD-dependent epimerase/dehydratase family protein n=1 Tax=Mycolicibacterium sp. S2-37 TaxID=2810297 RepID=UPI001A93C93E|nr:NAD(P)-dependent oxidoreductase [Mycolicibacterium sp. S2-37]MBO0679889.1 NAD(P)-dependent oxidoreductase [Mycolicibacterium sp. S2-37]
MKSVVITGGSGVVGRALLGQLRDDYTLIPIDRPELDILADRAQLADALRGADVVIHLAFDPGGHAGPAEHWRSERGNPVNEELFDTVLEVALAEGVALFLHASSIHVEDTMAWLRREGTPLVARPNAFRTDTPSGYGRSKRAQEAQLAAAADRFARGAVSLRLGGVTPDGAPLRQHHDPAVLDHERRVWLSHADLADLVRRLIDSRSEPGFDVVYAVSDNPGRFHDVSNRYGWTPRQSSGTGSGRTQPSTIAGVQPPTSSTVSAINPPA